MNFTGAKHGALGAHLYLTPQGKSLPRRMRLQQNRPIRPWATEAKINLHRKHHTHQAKQVNGKTNTVVSGNFKHQVKESKVGLHKYDFPKKECLKHQKDKAKKKIEPKAERYSDTYNTLFMSEFLFKQTNVTNSAPVTNEQILSANSAQINKAKSAPMSNVRKLPLNKSYVQVADESSSEMTQPSDILIANATFIEGRGMHKYLSFAKSKSPVETFCQQRQRQRQGTGRCRLQCVATRNNQKLQVTYNQREKQRHR